MGYTIFTTEFDQEISVTEVFPEFLAKIEHNGFQESARRTLSKLEMDTSLAVDLSDIKSSPTFLIDMSGSMRGYNIYNTVKGLKAAGDVMHEAGIPFEILGQTTVSWKGGLSRRKWLEEGRSPQPGRLNDLLHVVVKGMDEDWTLTRDNLDFLLIEGRLKENIDGEAIEWARGRIESSSEDGCLVCISDGASVDDSTLSVNDPNLLSHHLSEVMKEADEAGLAMSGVQFSRTYPATKIYEGWARAETGGKADQFLAALVAATLSADARVEKKISFEKNEMEP
jgi:cobaltochelatase CobT